MLTAGQRIGSYVVVSHLADGGTSEVYLVREGERSFALKILKEALCHLAVLHARLLNEAVTLESLQVDGVVRVFGNGDFEGRPYFVMEYLPTSFAQRLLGPRSLTETLPLLTTLAQVLADLHARGMVHRDVKPQNILFTAEGELRLIDFSHAKLPQEEAAVIPHSTETGAFLGTRDYAAPEQLLNAKSVDGRADVYALGVLLFEALCGRRPFAAAAEDELIRRRLTQHAPRLSSFASAIPPQLDSLVARMLARSAQDRPTAREVSAQLASVPRHYVPAAAWRFRAAVLLSLLCLSCPPRSLSGFSKVLDTEPLDEAISLLRAAAQVPAFPPKRAELTQKAADLERELGHLSQSARLYAEADQQFAALGLHKEQADCTTRLADLHLHQGSTASAWSLYDKAQELRGIRAARRESEGGEEYLFIPYRFGLFYLEQEDWNKALTKLLAAREAAALKPLWLARTEERLATLPGERGAQNYARSALQHAEEALRQEPESRRARMVHLRARLRLGALSRDEALQREAWDELRAVWAQDKRRGLWAHDFLELLMEGLDRDPTRADLKAQARAVLEEMDRQSQWQGDVHVNRWRLKLGA